MRKSAWLSSTPPRKWAIPQSRPLGEMARDPDSTLVSLWREEDGRRSGHCGVIKKIDPTLRKAGDPINNGSCEAAQPQNALRPFTDSETAAMDYPTKAPAVIQRSTRKTIVHRSSQLGLASLKRVLLLPPDDAVALR